MRAVPQPEIEEVSRIFRVTVTRMVLDGRVIEISQRASLERERSDRHRVTEMVISSSITKFFSFFS